MRTRPWKNLDRRSSVTIPPGRRRVVAVLVTMLTGISAIVGPSVGTAPVAAIGRRHGATQADNPRLQALVDELVHLGVPGVVAVVDNGTERWRAAAGAARLEPRQTMRTHARFRVGSVTKTFVATVVLQLVAAGKMTLDDTLETWLPGLVPGGDGITVRQLLDHTSGVFNFTNDETFLATLAAEPTRIFAPRELVAHATAHPPVFPPGTDWSYSNTNFVLAGLIIEEVTGSTVAAELGHRIFEPLGLHHTTFPYSSATITGYHAHGYVLSSDGRLVDVTGMSPSWAWAAGAIVSTAEDLARFYRALLGGRLLPPEQLAQMKDIVVVTPTSGYGLGLQVQDLPCGRVWGHGGAVPGYSNRAWYSEDGSRSVNVMVNGHPSRYASLRYTAAVNAAVCEMYGVEPPPQGTEPRRGWSWEPGPAAWDSTGMSSG
ncbi:MAG: beta-lactamase [Acidimicrobiales bacterium]|nr:beta-lactamase [Acidimicrobiales bacterium]